MALIRQRTSGIRYFQTVSRTFTMNSSLNGSDPTDTIAIRDPNKTIALPATCWSGSSSYCISSAKLAHEVVFF